MRGWYCASWDGWNWPFKCVTGLKGKVAVNARSLEDVLTVGLLSQTKT